MVITDDAVYYYTKVDWPSNFYPHEFPIRLFNNEEPYLARTGEHAFHMCKAAVFGDIRQLYKIQRAFSPFEALRLGREVRGFDKEVWNRRCRSVMDHVHRSKLLSSNELMAQARTLIGKRFVEASPKDVFWGVGLSENNPLIRDPRNWRGLNNHGQSWDRVLRRIKEELG